MIKHIYQPANELGEYLLVAWIKSKSKKNTWWLKNASFFKFCWCPGPSIFVEVPGRKWRSKPSVWPSAGGYAQPALPAQPAVTATAHQPATGTQIFRFNFLFSKATFCCICLTFYLVLCVSSGCCSSSSSSSNRSFKMPEPHQWVDRLNRCVLQK